MSKTGRNLFGATLSLMLVAGSSQAKEWRGIVPLASTREDVVRIFKQCNDTNPSCDFRLDDANVHIEFSGAPPSQIHKCSAQLRTDTVLLIEVTLGKALNLKEIGIHKRRLREFNLSPPRASYRGYIDDQEGLVLKTYEGRAVQIDYIAAAKDRRLCQDYYESPELFVEDIFSAHAPAISIICPTERTKAGKQVSISADIAGNPKITFLWTVTAGQIVSGQGTRQIVVDTTGLQGQVIKLTVSLGRVAASCEVPIS